MNRPGPDADCHATEEFEVDDYSHSQNITLYHSYIKIKDTHRVLTSQINVTCHEYVK